MTEQRKEEKKDPPFQKPKTKGWGTPTSKIKIVSSSLGDATCHPHKQSQNRFTKFGVSHTPLAVVGRPKNAFSYVVLWFLHATFASRKKRIFGWNHYPVSHPATVLVSPHSLIKALLGLVEEPKQSATVFLERFVPQMNSRQERKIAYERQKTQVVYKCSR